MNVLPFQAHSHYLAAPLPPAPHFRLITFPDPEAYCYPWGMWTQSLGRMSGGDAHRGLKQGRRRKRVLLAKSELFWGAPPWLGPSRGP